MLATYLKLSFRHLLRNRTFSLFHVAGLALGITASLLLWTYIASEWRFNRFHTKLPDLYRVLVLGSDGQATDYTPPALGPWLKSRFPELRSYVRTNGNGSGTVTCEEGSVRKVFREDAMAYADADFFRMFSHPAVAGTPMLDVPQQVAISESYARKYFGDTPPVGKTLVLDNQFGSTPYTVTGVFRDMPEETDYRLDMLFSLVTLANPANRNGNEWVDPDTWTSASYQTFVELRSGDLAALEGKVNGTLQEAFPGNDLEARFQPLSEVHLGKGIADPYPTFGNRGLLLALAAVSLLILLIAWINYINLATAQGLQQAQNVGIRRTVGATRAQVAGQYLTESFVLTLLACTISAVTTAALLPLVSEWTGKTLRPFSLLSGNGALIFGAVLLAGTLFSGAYVAWLLSGFRPAQALRQHEQVRVGGVRLRNALIVAQFAISIAFIAGTLVFSQQLRYMRHRDLGMNIERLLVIRGPEARYEGADERLNAFRSELESQAWIESFCFTGSLPGETFRQNFSTSGFSTEYSTPEASEKEVVIAIVDHRYQPTYALKIKAGENFSENDARLGWDQSGVLMLNETAAIMLGYNDPAKAAGQTLRWHDQSMKIKGVIGDYHHRGLQQAIEPMIFLPAQNTHLISLRLDAAGLPEKIGRLQQMFAGHFPLDPFEYYFESEDFDRQYAEEKRLAKIAMLAAMIAILLSCMGLLGLVLHTVARRTKEIGIRKVLGASTAGIAALLARDYVRLVLIAMFIAAPVAYQAAGMWLEGFAYRIELQWWVFALAGMLALAVALLTVGYQSIRAALANPVHSLRNE
ncbi:MAG: ABC transporter permease [Saprospiraceae bacterium]